MIYMSPEEAVHRAFAEIEQERRFKLYRARVFWTILFTLVIVPFFLALLLQP